MAAFCDGLGRKRSAKRRNSAANRDRMTHHDCGCLHHQAAARCSGIHARRVVRGARQAHWRNPADLPAVERHRNAHRRGSDRHRRHHLSRGDVELCALSRRHVPLRAIATAAGGMGSGSQDHRPGPLLGRSVGRRRDIAGFVQGQPSFGVVAVRDSTRHRRALSRDAVAPAPSTLLPDILRHVAQQERLHTRDLLCCGVHRSLGDRILRRQRTLGRLGQCAAATRHFRAGYLIRDTEQGEPSIARGHRASRPPAGRE